MAKRSTIGENPLDAVIQEDSLDTVVPNLSVVAQIGRAPTAPELPPEVAERLQELEARLKALGTEVAGLKAAVGETTDLKATVGQWHGELAGLRREVELLTAAAAANKALQAEVAQLKGELARLQARAGPGDLPFWMRGRKK